MNYPKYRRWEESKKEEVQNRFQLSKLVHYSKYYFKKFMNSNRKFNLEASSQPVIISSNKVYLRESSSFIEFLPEELILYIFRYTLYFEIFSFLIFF